MAARPNPWVPRASCHLGCLQAGVESDSRAAVTCRLLMRAAALAALAPGLAVLPATGLCGPAKTHLQRGYCRLVLRALGVRVSVSGFEGGARPNLRGVLVVSNHISWADIFVIGAVTPGAFVAKAEMTCWPGLGQLARMLRVIPIERGSLRALPGVVADVAHRLRSGKTVVAFPEGTTWCGQAHGRFAPALFQAAVDSGRPVQPVRLSYHHRDGRRSTAAAYIGEDSLGSSIRRLMTARRTVAHVHLGYQLDPRDSRRTLAHRAQAQVLGVGRTGAPIAHPTAA
ncbi:1-acyl-sn-glycerol-3-phosphate acyltransferase [Mycolicibacterium brumae]|uniref:1-acyl-sn-glycerol-3-phosphate acyltransferase n=1 Tax=Mycolicibacterium brumae TaxID=85968 RepID=A0A2G5P889_9MYCO|nr:1-acyl-sn-glycerol-3-phosphate acyltransferase [Mycolicibacterium brumae]PIB74579.1 1-acyl-sn-glycerol-3-phosphate acyltransferase [Mycolicibacterium brumae]